MTRCSPRSTREDPLSDLDAIDTHFAAEPWPWVASVELDGEVVLYNETNGRVHLVNDSGSLVWQLLDGATTVAEIGDAIAEATGGDVDVITYDVLSLVRMLADLGVIVGFDPKPVASVAPP